MIMNTSTAYYSGAESISNKKFTNNQARRHTLYIKDPASAITHFIGAIFSLGASSPLLIKAAQTHQPVNIIAMIIYSISLVALYSASTAYHTIPAGHPYEKTLKKLDHMMIFVLIAGSYTPICLLVLERRTGLIMLALVWGIAITGIIIKGFWVFCPKWVSSVLYISMGWICVLAFSQILNNLTRAEFGWLLAGGIIYTIGGVIYALKLPIFNNKHKNFGSHEIFHLFVMGGSACHFVVMYSLL